MHPIVGYWSDAKSAEVFVDPCKQPVAANKCVICAASHRAEREVEGEVLHIEALARVSATMRPGHGKHQQADSHYARHDPQPTMTKLNHNQAERRASAVRASRHWRGNWKGPERLALIR